MPVNERLNYLHEKALRLPLLPGVYLMHDKQDRIIYVGKAKALKNRVSQYFRSIEKHHGKVRRMVEHVYDFETIVTDSEFEALVLECSLIKQHMPKYNILLKDDKGYHYIRITTQDPYPRILPSFQRDLPGEYLGPYISSYAVRNAVSTAKQCLSVAHLRPLFSKRFRKRPSLFKLLY